MKIYHYNASTKEYIGESTARINPLEPNNFLIPANATEIEPITASENEVSVWNGTAWDIKSDYRGSVFWDMTTKEKQKITEIGVTQDSNWTELEPTETGCEWNGTAWEIPFATAKENKYAEISQAFNDYVTGSFTCSLGYPMQFDKTDSLLMEGAIQLIQASGATDGYLTDAENVSHYNVPLADIQTVKLEMLAEYATAHLKKQTLRTQIDSATTQAALDAIIY